MTRKSVSRGGTISGLPRFAHLLRPASLLAPLYGSDRFPSCRGLLRPGFRRFGRPLSLCEELEGEVREISTKVDEGSGLSSVTKRDRGDQLTGLAAGGSSLSISSTNTAANSGSYC